MYKMRSVSLSMNSKYPKISIITPNFNGEAYLEETIRSVLDQDYPNLEYIVIDGGSKDRSVALIESFSSQLSYWVSEPDKGQADAINKGFKKATGDWVGFLNSDDLYVPNALFKLAEKINQQTDQHWIVGGTEIFGNTNEIYRTRYSEFTNESKPIDWISYKSTSPQPSSFWTISALQKVGLLDTNFHFSFDSEFWLRLHINGYTPVSLNDVLSRFRIHSESKTSQSRLPFLKEHSRMLEKHVIHFSKNEISESKSILRVLESDARIAESLYGDKPYRELWKAFKLNPKCLTNRMFLGAMKQTLFY